MGGDESEEWEALDRNIMDASLRPPPTHGHGATAATWVLLDYVAFISNNHGNATTARSKTRTGQPIEVSLSTAPPPRVSYMCVHCPGLDPYKFATEPTIMATEADLVLIRATTPTPSLRLIPHPAALCKFFDREVGILRCCGSVPYIVAVLCNTIQSGNLEYALYLYRAGADAWTCHPLSLNGLVDPTPSIHVNTKTITVGGKAGTMAWVDLHRGILLCDLLPCAHSSPVLRYFPLPPPLSAHKKIKVAGCPRSSRDIALVQGRFNFTHMRIHVKPGSIIKGTYISQGWTKPGSNTMNFELLPKLSDDQQGTPQQTLERLHVGQPMLSLQSNDIVCLMAKVDQWDDDAWVLAIDMKNKRLKDVAEFGAERTLGISFAYISSKISEYLPTAQGIKGNLKRQGVVLTVPSHKKQTRMVHLSPPSWKGGDQQNSGTSIKGNLKRQGVLLTVPSHKKQTRMVHLSNPSWKGGDQQNSGTSMGDEEDNMDLDLDMMRICAMLHANRFINRSNGARHANVFT
uniref:DUF1618 domain-containing protein n=1 Tax=Oryza punctata TaxID=4537 RepID=A0A0E0M4N2_ORYPU